MLLFLPEGSARCFSLLEDARALAGAGRVLVLDALQLPPLRADACGYFIDDVPPEAILNLRPYLPAAVVPAAGGYVVRRAGATAEVLTIFRRGTWDLPKGKHDAWESDEACALREVREEIGLGDLALLAPLGSTLHGYPEKRRFAVKPTAWFAMRTRDDDHLDLQADEGIADAALDADCGPRRPPRLPDAPGARTPRGADPRTPRPRRGAPGLPVKPVPTGWLSEGRRLYVFPALLPCR